MELTFEGSLWYWRGPAPWYFVSVPEAESELLKVASRFVTYGWGMIPVAARIGGTEWTTSLWPKDALYILPVKIRVRKAESLVEGDPVSVSLRVGA